MMPLVDDKYIIVSFGYNLKKVETTLPNNLCKITKWTHDNNELVINYNETKLLFNYKAILNQMLNINHDYTHDIT